MKLFEHYTACIHNARDVFQLQMVVRDVCRMATASPLSFYSLADPAKYAVEVAKNLGLLQQLLELASEKLKEFEGGR